MRVRVTDFLIYRWRYIVSYGFLIVCVGVVLFIASFYVPGELREAELTSSVQSGSLSIKSLSPSMVIDLPYHVLQRVIFNIFGVSTFTIKLPSLILGIGTVLGLFLLLSTWFRRNVAVFGTIIAVTSTQFLFLVQDGTPGIMHTFVAVWLLFAATYVTRQKLFGTLWKVITLVLIGTALYLPLGSYLVLAILTTSLFHPHIRHIIKRFSRLRFILAIVLGCIAITPLIYASILDPGVARTLLGIPDHSIDFWRNTTQVGTDIAGFASQSTSALVRPLYSLSIVLLAGIGLYKLITYKYTARSYITMVWGALLIPLIILNPGTYTSGVPYARPRWHAKPSPCGQRPAAGMPDPRSRAGMPDPYHYAHLLRAAKRADPGDDVMSLLMRACADDEGEVSLEEFENLFWLFAVACNEMVRNGIPGGWWRC